MKKVVSNYYYKRAKVKGLMYKGQRFNQAVIEATLTEFDTLKEDYIDMDFDTCVNNQEF